LVFCFMPHHLTKTLARLIKAQKLFVQDFGRV
jgi:hypothetical protein